MDDPFLPTRESDTKKYVIYGTTLLVGGFLLTCVGILFEKGASSQSALIPLAIGLLLLGIVTGLLCNYLRLKQAEGDTDGKLKVRLAFCLLFDTPVLSSSLSFALSLPSQLPLRPDVRDSTGHHADRHLGECAGCRAGA